MKAPPELVSFLKEADSALERADLCEIGEKLETIKRKVRHPQNESFERHVRDYEYDEGRQILRDIAQSMGVLIP